MNDVSGDSRFIDRYLSDGRRLTLQPLTFGSAQLGIGPKPPLQDVGVFDDCWDFPTIEDAFIAFVTWNPEETPEPDGWHRHPSTGRYRHNGDKALEYVKGEGDVIEQVKSAILATQGKDRVIINIEEDPERSPFGWRFFVVTSQSSECAHDPRCEWADRVFQFQDRCVVVANRDLPFISVANVQSRMTAK